MAQTDDGPLIVLGMTDANVARMKQDDPILFNLRELRLPDKWVCISCKRRDGTAAFPADLKEFIGLAFKGAGNSPTKISRVCVTSDFREK